jgi:hypothetical protein
LKLPQDNLDCFHACVIQNAMEEVFHVHHIDSMEATLTHSFTRQEIETDFEDVTDDIIEAVQLLEASPPYPSESAPPFEMLVPANTTIAPSIVQAPILELKQLPVHLKYAYLEDNQTLLMIIALELSLGEEEKLLKVLRNHKIALGWTITNIKGISPSKCMHKILLGDEARPTRDYIDYRRLKKETQKWDLGSTLTMVVNNYTNCARAYFSLGSSASAPISGIEATSCTEMAISFKKILLILFLFYFLFFFFKFAVFLCFAFVALFFKKNVLAFKFGGML